MMTLARLMAEISFEKSRSAGKEAKFNGTGSANFVYRVFTIWPVIQIIVTLTVVLGHNHFLREVFWCFIIRSIFFPRIRTDCA